MPGRYALINLPDLQIKINSCFVWEASFLSNCFILNWQRKKIEEGGRFFQGWANWIENIWSAVAPSSNILGLCRPQLKSLTIQLLLLDVWKNVWDLLHVDRRSILSLRIYQRYSTYSCRYDFPFRASIIARRGVEVSLIKLQFRIMNNICFANLYFEQIIGLLDIWYYCTYRLLYFQTFPEYIELDISR